MKRVGRWLCVLALMPGAACLDTADGESGAPPQSDMIAAVSGVLPEPPVRPKDPPTDPIVVPYDPAKGLPRDRVLGARDPQAARDINVDVDAANLDGAEDSDAESVSE